MQPAEVRHPARPPLQLQLFRRLGGGEGGERGAVGGGTRPGRSSPAGDGIVAEAKNRARTPGSCRVSPAAAAAGASDLCLFCDPLRGPDRVDGPVAFPFFTSKLVSFFPGWSGGRQLGRGEGLVVLEQGVRAPPRTPRVPWSNRLGESGPASSHLMTVTLYMPGGIPGSLPDRGDEVLAVAVGHGRRTGPASPRLDRAVERRAWPRRAGRRSGSPRRTPWRGARSCRRTPEQGDQDDEHGRPGRTISASMRVTFLCNWWNQGRAGRASRRPAPGGRERPRLVRRAAPSCWPSMNLPAVGRGQRHEALA